MKTPEYLEYDGHLLHWRNPRDGERPASYKATSGLPDHQVPSDQCLKEMGPVPAGKYRVILNRDIGPAQTESPDSCTLRPARGIQSVPRGGPCEGIWANWGNNRARFEAADEHTKHVCPNLRSGFYLHDSTKGYSHGCIEVENAFFNRLYFYCLVAITHYLELRVKYSHATTYGGTRA